MLGCHIKVVIQVQGVDEATGTVFLVYQNIAAGYTSTDTFVVDAKDAQALPEAKAPYNPVSKLATKQS
jgi:hypothetical protein